MANKILIIYHQETKFNLNMTNIGFVQCIMPCGVWYIVV